MDGKHMSRNVIAALPVAFMLPFVAGLAALLAAIASRRVSTSAIFTGLVALFLLSFVALTQRRRPRAGVLAACHALVWTPFIALAAWDAVDTAIVTDHVPKCGTGLMAGLMVGVPVGGFVLLAAGIGAGTALAQRGTDRALRTAAVGATALALVAFAYAAPRMTRPDADTYLDSLPVAGELRDGTDVELLGRHLGYHRVVAGPPSPQIDNGPGAPLPSLPDECRVTGLERVQSVYPGGDACPVLQIRTDRGHDVAVIERIVPTSATGAAVTAFEPSTGELVGLWPSTVADRIGPPIGWTLGAALGGLAGAAFVYAASRIRRAAALPLGTVVLGEQTDHLATYRTTGAPSFAAARPGTLALWRTTRTDLAASLDAAAIAVAALGAAPLVVARLAGVL